MLLCQPPASQQALSSAHHVDETRRAAEGGRMHGKGRSPHDAQKKGPPRRRQAGADLGHAQADEQSYQRCNGPAPDHLPQIGASML